MNTVLDHRCYRFLREVAEFKQQNPQASFIDVDCFIEKRLESMPFARFCVSCKSELERQAKMRGESFTDISLMDSRYRHQAGSD